MLIIVACFKGNLKPPKEIRSQILAKGNSGIISNSVDHFP